MERIKRALEKARAERQNPVDAVGAGPPRRAEAAPEPVGQERAHLADIKVDYTETDSVEVDEQRLREHRIVATAVGEPAAAAYKVLRTRLLQRMRAHGWKTLAITSTGEGNGKTVTAINLAVSLAAEVNQTVLLVDADLRRPSVARYFLDRPRPGLSDYLTEDRPLGDLFFSPGVDRLVILPGNHSYPHSSEMLTSPKMLRLVEELKGRYPDRLIIFDMPPVLAGDDVIAFSPYVDALLLIVEEGKSTKDELSRAFELLGDEKIVGTVLNKSEQASSGTGYGYY